MGFSSLPRPKYNPFEKKRPFYETNILTDAHSDHKATGIGFVSDPGTHIALQLGYRSGTGYWYPFVASALGKGNKSGYGAGALESLASCLMGGNGYYLNTFDAPAAANTEVVTRWLLTSRGLPMPIAEYRQCRGAAGLDFEALAFTWDEIAYIPVNLIGLTGPRWSIQVDRDGTALTHHEIAGLPLGSCHVMVLTSPGWPHKMVFACYPANQWFVSSVGNQSPNDGDYTNTGGPVTANSVWMGLGNVDGAKANHRACFALSLQPATLTDEEVRDAVKNGLAAWEGKYALALAYWESFWSGYGNQWDGIDPEIRSKGLVAVHQIAANTYKGAVVSGASMWPKVWIRDCAWAVRSLGKLCPEFAKTVVDWFATSAAPINNANSYLIDGPSYEVFTGHDAYAAFLYAMGCIWEDTQDTARFVPLLAQLQSALTYVKANYSVADKHVLDTHPHDYWDDPATYYNSGEMDVTKVKYESVIDVFNTAALRKVAPLLAALGDSTNAAWCNATYPQLLIGLEDYRDNVRLAGGFHYAIKTAAAGGGLYDTVIASPGTIYAAHLLDDAVCREALLDRENARMLGVKCFPVRAVFGFSNYLGVETAQARQTVWGPHLLLVAGELAKLGDYRMLGYIKQAFPFASWPEDVKFDDEAEKLIHFGLAANFVWSLGELVQLCNTLAALR